TAWAMAGLAVAWSAQGRERGTRCRVTSRLTSPAAPALRDELGAGVPLPARTCPLLARSCRTLALANRGPGRPRLRGKGWRLVLLRNGHTLGLNNDSWLQTRIMGAKGGRL